MIGLPDGGKIVVLPPALAAEAAELHPEWAERIFTMPGIADGTAYVIDLDAFAAGWIFKA